MTKNQEALPVQIEGRGPIKISGNCRGKQIPVVKMNKFVPQNDRKTLSSPANISHAMTRV